MLKYLAFTMVVYVSEGGLAMTTTESTGIVLSEEEMNLKDIAWRAFGRRQKMPFDDLARAMTRASWARILIRLGVVVVDEAEPGIVRKTKLPVRLKERPVIRGSEFGDVPQSVTRQRETMEVMRDRIASLSERERQILDACAFSVDWASTSHVYRIKLVEVKRRTGCKTSDIAALMKKIGIPTSGNKGLTWVLPSWFRGALL